MDIPDSLRSLLGGGGPSPEERATRLDGGEIVAEGKDQIAIEIPDDSDVDAERIEAALSGQASSRNVRGQAGGETTVTPVASGSDIHITDSAFDLSDWEYKAFLDDQITNLMDNRVDYNTETGKWILANDDLIPGILIRMKSLLLGEDGLTVQPDDPDAEADQRLADHLESVYEGDADVDTHIDPGQVVDRVLEQNVMNAVYVGRSTDLQHLDVDDLSYVKDGETGEEIYIQHQTAYTTFDLGEDDGGDRDVDVNVEHTDDEQALEIGSEVFDVRLYRTPPLQSIADDVVNKLQLKRLQGRKAEIASIGGVIIRVNPPAWLDEADYDNYVAAEDDDFGDESGRLLELVMEQQIDAALETLQDYQTATVMSIPENWETDTIELPEMDESMSSMIRDYNEAISRRLLLPLDLIELKEGPELSRNSMMQMFLDQITGWQGEITDLFDQFAQTQAEIHGLNGSVEHSLPPIAAEDEAEIVKLFQYAGLLGLSESEGRELANKLEGVDLETDQTEGMPESGGPADQQDRQDQIEEALQNQGPTGSDTGPEPQGERGQQATQAGDSGVNRRDVLATLGIEAEANDPSSYPMDPDAWPPRAARAAWENVGANMDDCMAQMVTEAGWGDRKAQAFCEQLQASLHQQNPLEQFEAAASFSEGDEVEAPDGVGVVVEVRTENFDGPSGDEVEASEDDPAYVVGVESGANVYRESDLSEGSIDAEIENPEEDLAGEAEGMATDIEAAGWMQVHAGPTDFDYPDSWQESETPARLILLKAWAGMNGQFDCGGDCCKGTMLRSGMSNRAANQFCAAMKDRVLMWEGWRGSKAPVKAKHAFSGFETMREAAAHVRDIVERKTPEGHTTELKKRTDLSEDAFAILVRDRDGNFQASLVVKRSNTDDSDWVVIGSEGLFR